MFEELSASSDEEEKAGNNNDSKAFEDLIKEKERELVKNKQAAEIIINAILEVSGYSDGKALMKQLRKTLDLTEKEAKQI